MFFVTQIRKIILRHYTEMRWHSILASIAIYMVCSFILLYFAGETGLIQHDNFVYWLIVTASTVGYGDYSPETTVGKYVVALFIIPFGLGLFALTIGRLAAFMSFQWRKGVQGLKHLNYDNHILIIGWHDIRTMHLIELLLTEQEHTASPKQIVLCAMKEIDNPMPDQIGFVRTRSFSDDADMTRACIDSAASIIIDNPEDDITMTAALYAYSRNPNAHMIAYFQDEKLGKLLRSHCPTVEYTPSVSVEMLAKAAVDPGSSYLHHQLLNVSEGMTQYSLLVPKLAQPITVKDLFLRFKTDYDATLIAIQQTYDAQLQINPKFETEVHQGMTVYYIADERINNFNWST